MELEDWANSSKCTLTASSDESAKDGHDMNKQGLNFVVSYYFVLD